MIIDRINNWLNTKKPYFFTYKDGFFRLSYLSNSPDLIVSSCENLPFMKHNKDQHIIHTDNLFVKSALCYLELEKGLWVINSKVKYKKNVSFTPVYDTSLPSDYYCLTINIVDTNFYEFNNFKIENESISFLKPKKDFNHCHFRGSFENQYIVYFSREWAEKNILAEGQISNSISNLFNDSDNGFVNYKFKKQIFHDIVDQYKVLFDNQTNLDSFKLKTNTYHFLNAFMNSLPEFESLNLVTLSFKERIMIKKIEDYLMEHIYEKFMGIEKLSTHFKISPTKLKKNFKYIHGLTLLHYFQTMQMRLALEIIKKDSLKIKEIAEIFHYSNSSKFAKTFQKVHGFLPSEAE